MGQLRIIVALDRPELFESLRQEFAEAVAAGRVQILLDGRRGQRRGGIERHEPKRRRKGRRRHPEKIDDKLSGWWAVHGQPEPPPEAGCERNGENW